MGVYVNIVISPEKTGAIPTHDQITEGIRALLQENFVSFEREFVVERFHVPTIQESVGNIFKKLTGSYKKPEPIFDSYTQVAQFRTHSGNYEEDEKTTCEFSSHDAFNKIIEKIKQPGNSAWTISFPLHKECPVVSKIEGNEFLGGLEINLSPTYGVPSNSAYEDAGANWKCLACRSEFPLYEAVENKNLACPECKAPLDLGTPDPPIRNEKEDDWAFTLFHHAYRFSIQFSEYKLGVLSWDFHDPVFTREWEDLANRIGSMFGRRFIVHADIW